MENLAGKANADVVIERELRRCGIPSVRVALTRSEVPYILIGRLGNFTFTRAWYYWAVEGKVPVEVARELYADPVGKTDIRVGGHCGCPSPAEYGTQWYTLEGKLIYRTQEKELCNKILAHNNSGCLAETAIKILQENEFADNPEQVPGARGFVECYHIDSEVGLRIFVDTLKRYNLC